MAALSLTFAFVIAPLLTTTLVPVFDDVTSPKLPSGKLGPCGPAALTVTTVVTPSVTLTLYLFSVTLREAFNIQHYAPHEGFLGWHCERSTSQTNQRALVFMTYLNDVTDGGETEYYFQKLKVKPVKGKMVVWPTDFTHLHRGITSPTQEKYIATGWYNFWSEVEFHLHGQLLTQKLMEAESKNK